MSLVSGCQDSTTADGFVSLDRLAGSVRREPPRVARDPRLRDRYLQLALSQIPRILGAIDRNPYRATYGCLDRAFWHYRTSDFPSAMYQEAVWPLALVYTHEMPGNRWYRDERVRELAIAGLRYGAHSAHRDGSCDDYYPFERALGAAVFATNAATQTYLLLGLNDVELRRWFIRRADWISRHNESGRLANHQALAALALHRCSLVTGSDRHREAARDRLGLALAWQSEEGWFEEYGGADPGYQTVTLDCLAVYRNLTEATWLNSAMERGVGFARSFLHPDDSYGGEYGSRGTYHFYPHGMELLARESAAAADLADGFLRAIGGGRQAWFSDDRMFAHYTGNLLEAWLDWSPERPAAEPEPATVDHPSAQLFVRRTEDRCTVVSTSRGGVFKHFDRERCRASDAGLIVEFDDGRIAVSQMHELGRDVTVTSRNHAVPCQTIEVAGPLHWTRFEIFTPWKFLAFRVAMLLVGRWSRGVVRRLLQRRLITGRRQAPIALKRTIELSAATDQPKLRVVDAIRLTNRRRRVQRMSFGTDHQFAYVAASGVYQDSTLQPWTDLDRYVETLNRDGEVTITREF